MKLSKVLTIALISTVGFTSTAMAKGTTAGTRIINQPVLQYSFGSVKKTTKAPVASYVVDKVINFTLTRSEATEHKVVAGTTKVVEFKLTNIGNSDENFKLSKWHNVQDVKFLSKKFYVDTNGNGVLDKAEKVDSSLVKKLTVDGSKKIWMELKIDPKAVINKRSDSGLLAQAVNASLKPYKASAKNRMNVEDIVFADGSVYEPVEKVRDGKISMWYGFTIIKNDNNVKLDVSTFSKDTAITVTYDPINGTKNPKAIPGAKLVKRWHIKNNTKTTATNVKFEISINDKKEFFSKNNNNTWFAKENRPVQHVWHSGKGVYKDAKCTVKGNTVTCIIPKIEPGVDMQPHIVTEVR
jgi:hypothetical protein